MERTTSTHSTDPRRRRDPRERSLAIPRLAAGGAGVVILGLVLSAILHSSLRPGSPTFDSPAAATRVERFPPPAAPEVVRTGVEDDDRLDRASAIEEERRLLLDGASAWRPLPAPALPEAPLQHRWATGDRWTVHTYLLELDAEAPDLWRGPIVWRFQVGGLTSLDGEPAYEIRAEPERENGPALAAPETFYYTPDRALVAWESVQRLQGEERFVARTIDRSDREAPASGLLTLAPFELPAPGARAFEIESPEDWLSPLPEAIVRIAPHLPVWPRESGLYLGVEFRDRLDRSPIRQVWSREDPRWPIASATSCRLSLRID